MTKSLLQQSKGFDNYNNKQFIEKKLTKLNINEFQCTLKEGHLKIFRGP